MRNSIPIATLDFNAQDVTTDEVADILNNIRSTDGIIVYEQGHNETYTIAREDH